MRELPLVAARVANYGAQLVADVGEQSLPGAKIQMQGLVGTAAAPPSP